jgi:hypothetical protein
LNAEVTDDGHYLIITVQRGTDPKNRIFYKDLSDPNSKVAELLDKADAKYAFLGNDGPTFWFQTDLNAPLGRIISIDTAKPLSPQPKELVPESSDKLEAVSVVGNRFIAVYLKDARSLVKLFKPDGSPDGEIALPGIGSAGGFTGKRKDRETFYSFTSFTTPTSIFRYNFDNRQSQLLFQPKVKFNPDDYTTEQVFYNSADGTRIPMFISYKKGMKRDEQNPTYLYGYGGFDISEMPSFSPANLVWMEMGGIFALANLRGGGEYGEKWHEAGMLHVKQNVLRFHRGGAVLDHQKVYIDIETRDRRWEQRRVVSRRLPDAAARSLRRHPTRGGSDGHAALPKIYHRLGLDFRLRQFREQKRLSVSVRLLTVASHRQRLLLSTDADHDGRSRRPRRACAQLQIRGDVASRARLRQTNVDPD